MSPGKTAALGSFSQQIMEGSASVLGYIIIRITNHFYSTVSFFICCFEGTISVIRNPYPISSNHNTSSKVSVHLVAGQHCSTSMSRIIELISLFRAMMTTTSTFQRNKAAEFVASMNNVVSQLTGSEGETAAIMSLRDILVLAESV